MFILTPILFQKFSLELQNGLDAQGSCNGVFLFFFSKSDRIIALRAPKDSYLHDYGDEIYHAVKGYYTNAIDKPDSHTFAHALNMTLLTMYNCMKKEEGMCLGSNLERLYLVFLLTVMILAVKMFPWFIFWFIRRSCYNSRSSDHRDREDGSRGEAVGKMGDGGGG